MIVYALSGLLVGVFTATLVDSAFLLWATLAIGATSLVFLRTRSGRILIFIAVLGFSLGVIRFSSVNAQSPLEAYEGQGVSLIGYADGEFTDTGSSGRLYVRVTAINGQSVHERILVRTERWPAIALGTPLALHGVLEYPWVGDESFDYRAFLKKDGIRLVMEKPSVSVSEDVVVPYWRRGVLGVQKSLLMFRDLMASGVQRGIPEPAGAYINGILLGMRQDLPEDVTDAFARTGTTHVLAISGYNIAIIAYGFMLVCLRFVERRRAVWIAIAGIVAFTIITGASASVVRAALMGSLVLVAQAWGKQIHMMTLILLSAVVMTLVNPYVLRYDVGFQLSFVAVIGLVYLSPMLDRMVTVPLRLRSMWQMVSATGSATIATLPLILYYFGALPIYSLPANLMILPVIPYAMAFGALAGVTASIVPQVAGVIGMPAWALATWQLTIVKWVSWLPGASVSMSLSWMTMAVAYGCIIILYFYGNRRSRYSTP